MKPAKAYGADGTAIYTGDVVCFEHAGKTVKILVDEFARGCARGNQCDEMGRKHLPEKRWRVKLTQCRLAHAHHSLRGVK